MSPQAIFGLQFALSFLAWAVVIQMTFIPRMKFQHRNEKLLWLTLPHLFRHIGMVVLVPGVVAQPLPISFATTAAYGDLLTGLLALAAAIGLHARWGGAITLVWLFNIIGTFDLANALRQPDAIASFGAAWYIPTFFVPLLLVTHFLIFKELITKPIRCEAAKAI